MANSADIAELVARIKLDISNLEKNMNLANAKVKSGTSQMQASFGGGT